MLKNAKKLCCVDAFTICTWYHIASITKVNDIKWSNSWRVDCVLYRCIHHHIAGCHGANNSSGRLKLKHTFFNVFYFFPLQLPNSGKNIAATRQGSRKPLLKRSENSLKRRTPSIVQILKIKDNPKLKKLECQDDHDSQEMALLKMCQALGKLAVTQHAAQRRRQGIRGEVPPTQLDMGT